MSFEGISQYLATLGVLGRLTTVTAPALVIAILSYFFWWRAWESARAGKASSRCGDGDGVSSLPSPVAVLPRWLGLIGGHTMQINSEKVSQSWNPSAGEICSLPKLYPSFGRRSIRVALFGYSSSSSKRMDELKGWALQRRDGSSIGSVY